MKNAAAQRGIRHVFQKKHRAQRPVRPAGSGVFSGSGRFAGSVAASSPGSATSGVFSSTADSVVSDSLTGSSHAPDIQVETPILGRIHICRAKYSRIIPGKSIHPKRFSSGGGGGVGLDSLGVDGCSLMVDRFVCAPPPPSCPSAPIGSSATTNNGSRRRINDFIGWEKLSAARERRRGTHSTAPDALPPKNLRNTQNNVTIQVHPIRQTRICRRDSNKLVRPSPLRSGSRICTNSE